MNSAGDQGRSGSSTWLGVISRLLVTLLFILLLLFLGSCGFPAQPGTATPTSAAATAYLLVEVAPRGAQIYVDGMRSGRTPATLVLRPGQYIVRVEQDGFEPLVETVNLAADDEATISRALVPLPASSVPTVTLIAPTESGSDQPLPDLAITHAQIDLQTGGSCDYASTVLGVRVWIENLGNADADSFAVEVNGIQQMVAGGLEAGQTVTIWFVGYIPDGENVLLVDATDQIQEIRKDNNTFSQRLTVPTLPPTCTPPASQSSAATVASKTPEPTAALPTATHPPPSKPAAVTMREGQVPFPTYPYANFNDILPADNAPQQVAGWAPQRTAGWVTSEAWTEIWYPVAGMGGLRCADETAAMNLSAGDGQAHVAVAVSRSWSGESVLLLNGQEQWRQTVSLQPGQPFLGTADLGTDVRETGRLTLRLEAPDGTVLSECTAELDLKG